MLNAAGRGALLCGEAQFSLRLLLDKKEFESFPSGYGLVSCEQGRMTGWKLFSDITNLNL